MLGRGKVKLGPDLYKRAAARAKAAGHASVDEYVAKLVEQDVKAAEDKALKEKVLEQMKGLGYMQ